MKEIRCNKCSKLVNVDDDYNYKRCPNCKIKDEAYLIKKRESDKWDKQAKQDIKGLGLKKDKLPKILWNFSVYAKDFEKNFHRKAIYEDDYLKELSHAKLEVAHEENEQLREKHKSESKKLHDKYKKYINVAYAPCHGKKCEDFRWSKVCDKFGLKVRNLEPELEHADNCEDCDTWLYNFMNNMLFDVAEDFEEPKDRIEELEEKVGGKVLDVDLDSLRKNEGMTKFISEGKIEPLRPQYEKETESKGLGANAWGEESHQEESKPKESHQDKLKKMFGDNRTE